MSNGKSDFANLDYWKAIILYGLNNATYKIALGKTLLDLTRGGSTSVPWEELSKYFLQQYLTRLQINNTPQQANPSRMTVMERIVKELRAGRIAETEAIAQVGRLGFNDVIPRFQTILKDKDLAQNKFYTFDFGKKLILHDALFEVSETGFTPLEEELETRWSLLEGAFTIVKDNWQLSNDIREIYLAKGHVRKCLSGNIPFLNGYQGDSCFYCGERMDANDIHVDHVLPRQVISNDEVWNLVLSHSYCNTSKSDKLVGPHYIEKLIARNENIMGSNHPWKAKIEKKLGANALRRKQALQKHYDDVRIVIGRNYWGGTSGYSLENDDFFKKLITRLNNG